MESFQTLIHQQQAEIRELSRIVPNLKKMGQAKYTVTIVDRRIQTLKELLTSVKKRDAFLRATFPDKLQGDCIYFRDDQLSECHDSAEESLDQLDAIRVNLMPAVNHVSGSPLENVSMTTAFKKKIPFPRIDIPRFNGALDEWLTFRDRFSSLVIGEARLTDYERMHYLCASLSGAASDAVSHLDVTENNFAIAWKVLTDRFENNRRLVDSYLKKLYSAPPAKQMHAESLTRLRDIVNSVLQALKKLKRPVEHWDDMVVYIVTEKLDIASRSDWELVIRNSKEYPTYEELDNFLQSRARMLESLPNQNKSNAPSQGSKQTPSRINVLSTAATTQVCSVCKQEHPLFQCSRFVSYSAARRRQIILEQKRCLNCFRIGHISTKCSSPHRCRQCSKLHHTLLHDASATKLTDSSAPTGNSGAVDNEMPNVISQTAISSLTKQPVLLATACVRVYSSTGRSMDVRALLDQGSEVTFVSENVAQLLRLPRSRFTVRIDGVNDCQSVARYATIIRIGTTAEAERPQTTAAIILPTLSKYSCHNGQWDPKWTHLNGLEFADDPFSNAPIDVIIGSNLYGSSLREGLRIGQPDQPVAQNTVFGWILSGVIAESAVVRSRSEKYVHHETFDQLTRNLTRFWEIENVTASVPMSPRDQQCEDHFVMTHTRTRDGRYVVRLPFVQPTSVDLGESRQLATQSLFRLEKRLKRDTDMAAAYAAFLSEYETLGHMTKVARENQESPLNTCYIPHHAVVRDHSATTRLRVVFNASSRTANGQSLNDNLLPGPRLQTDIAAIILRWRQFRYVLTADIAKMYRQILVDPRDARYQRILWRPTPSAPVEEYQLQTVTYGTVSAPFLALRVLKQLTIDEGSSFPLALPVLNEQTYVDDCIFGANTEEQAFQIRDQLVALLHKGGFRLRKWASNNATLLSDVDASDCGLACERDLGTKDGLTILGIAWHPARDMFYFRVAPALDAPVTKRTILSEIARVFDPLGWITPIVVTAKLFLRELWELSCDWDEDVPMELGTRWTRFRSQLSALGQLAIPRWIGPSRTLDWQLHGFADASSRAYAAVVYLRVRTPNNQTVISMLMAKSRVAPLKVQTIPRLELCAALILARLIDYVRGSLGMHSIPCHCWSDSAVVLEWLRQSPSKWTTFVANRVAQIHELAIGVSWQHVATADNPADCASRGVAPSELQSHPLWWSGPPWLQFPSDQWPKSSPDPAPSIINCEERRSTMVHISKLATPWDLQSRFSSWSKLLRVTAFIMRFAQQARRRASNAVARVRDPISRDSLVLSTSDINKARLFWLKTIQSELFPTEIQLLETSRTVAKASPLSVLAPYLDGDGLIRVRGRLRGAPWPEARKYPIVLGSHPLVRLLIEATHKQLLHAGPQLTASHIRQQYWIIRARPLVRSTIYKCIPCTRERGNLLNQLMGDLPSCRVAPTTRAFLHAGIDYAGPITIRKAAGRRAAHGKAYIAVFVCMTTKAMHLELVSSYSTEMFLAAYHRFISRRGLPSDVYSDNGTNFRGAERELKQACQAIVNHADFRNDLATRGTQWHFIPPSAPHFGGLWEAAVRSVKSHLKRCIGTHILTFEEMATLLCRIEACLNSRPLGALSDHIDDYQFLTPGHFLIHGSLVSLPEASVLSVTENRLSRWQLVQRLQEQFWGQWSRDYLHTLQQRPKWRTIQRLVKIGQLVLLHDPSLPPSHWSLARIIACHPGDDGLIRVVTIKTSHAEYKRPITKLCFLPVDINSEEHPDSSIAGGETAQLAT